MGIVTIQEMTCKNPISLIGYEAGICWGAAVGNQEKDKARGLDCLRCNHGRTLEFPQIYITIDGYSARMVRELYTHIGGAPTRLQASTRYIEYGEFEYITPPSIRQNEAADKLYDSVMALISTSIRKLEEAGIPKEDTANLLPLGMTTKVVCKINLRTLIDMSHQRMCARAYWEFRELFRHIRAELKNYSKEWSFIVDNYFEPKCNYLGYCPEKFTCGKMNITPTTPAN